jgi:LmbE family N-acetylglucosaminyl deacetylase
MSKQKLLVVEAHSDDSCISIAGFLEKNREKYDYHFVLVTTSDITLHHYGFLTREERMNEYRNYVDYFNGTWHKEEALPLDADAKLDTIPKREIVSHIEKAINKVQPSILICQGPSFHHDHTLVYESLIAATRPTSQFCPEAIYIMENPTYVHSLGPQTDFKPDVYVNLSEEHMKKKLDCYRTFFPSQIREEGNYLSENGIRSWARYRGIEARCRFAEAMQTFRCVI